MAAHNSFSITNQVLLTDLGIQSRFPHSEGSSLLWSNKKDIIISADGKKSGRKGFFFFFGYM